MLLRSSLPVVPHLPLRLGRDESRDIARVARRLLADEPTLNATAPFGPRVAAGVGAWPALVLEDHSAIRLFERSADLSYSYRALLLAGEGDQVAIGVPRSPGFERYCRKQLGLGAAEVLIPNSTDEPKSLVERCLADGSLLDHAIRKARRNAGLNVIPYMGTGGVWRLAGTIAGAADVEVRVAAPPPRLTRRVNDKLWFAERVTELFGHRALPQAYAAFGLAAAAGRVAAIATRCAAVAVKVPDSASSAGNIVLNSTEVLGFSLRGLQENIGQRLRCTGWRGQFPVMVTAWETPIVASPSVQLWIPERGRDEIVIEGIFDQFVLGAARVFGGAAPTVLSKRWQERLTDEAGRIGFLFQELGYFGRCSFDAILTDHSQAEASLHWIECNGRWGGTSIPMTLANRLVGDWHQRPFVIIERNDLSGPGQSVEAFLGSIAADLYVVGKRSRGAVLLSPGQVERGTGYEIMVMADTPDAARKEAESLALKLAPAKDAA